MLTRKQLRHLKNTMDHFWERLEEGVSVGIERVSPPCKGVLTTCDPIIIEDIVLYCDELKTFWSLPKVEDLISVNEDQV